MLTKLWTKFKLHPVRYTLNLIQMMLCVCAATVCVSVANQPKPSKQLHFKANGSWSNPISQADVIEINKRMKGYAVVEAVTTLSAVLLDNGTTTYRLNYDQLQVLPSYASNMDLQIEQGRFVKSANEIVLSHSVAVAMYGKVNPVGRTLKTPYGLPVKIVGVSQDVKVIENFDRIGSYVLRETNNIPLSTLEVKPLIDKALIKERLAEVLKQRYPKADFFINNDDSPMSLTPFFLMFLVFAIMALISCAAGIFALQLIDNTTRTKELGLRQAMGAHAGLLVQERLLESVAFVLVGSVLGLLASKYVIATLERTVGNHLFSSGIYFDAKVAVVVVGVMVLMGVLASWYPAVQAARLKPTVALKED